MVRPRKCRKVRITPATRFYKPQGIPVKHLVVLTIKDEELEALNLADAQSLDHETAAAQMEISRSTFSRILTSARNTIAQALTSGAAIRIQGGDFERIPPSFPHPSKGHRHHTGKRHDRRGEINRQANEEAASTSSSVNPPLKT